MEEKSEASMNFIPSSAINSFLFLIQKLVFFLHCLQVKVHKTISRTEFYFFVSCFLLLNFSSNLRKHSLILSLIITFVPFIWFSTKKIYCYKLINEFPIYMMLMFTTRKYSFSNLVKKDKGVVRAIEVSDQF